MSVNKVNIDGSLTTIADLIQVAALPTAGAAYLGKIYQYIGATSDPLVNGYFYKCISDGEQSPTYSWENVTLGQIIQVETMPTATADNSGAIVQYVGATDANYINGYFYKCVSDGGVTPVYSWEKIQVSDGGDTIQVDELPTASADELGNIYEYVGTTTANYINGRFYRCISDGASTPTYSWEEVDLGDSTPHWSGTRAEYEVIKNTLEAGTYVSITDDYDDGLEVVDVIENENMNPVTSNAVANMCKSTTTLLNNNMENSTDTLIAQLALPKGKWVVFGQLHTNVFSGDNLLTLAITIGSAATAQADVVDQRRQIVDIWGFVHGQRYFELSAETTVKMYARADFPSGTLAVIKALLTAIPVA